VSVLLPLLLLQSATVRGTKNYTSSKIDAVPVLDLEVTAKRSIQILKLLGLLRVEMYDIIPWATWWGISPHSQIGFPCPALATNCDKSRRRGCCFNAARSACKDEMVNILVCVLSRGTPLRLYVSWPHWWHILPVNVVLADDDDVDVTSSISHIYTYGIEMCGSQSGAFAIQLGHRYRPLP